MKMETIQSLPDKRKRAFGVKGLIENGADLIALLGAFGIIAIAALVVLDVLMRWIFNAPIFGVDDICVYVLAVAISSFFPLGLAKGQFVTVRFLGTALGVRFALWFEVLGAVCTLGVFALFAWRLLFYSIDVTRSGLATVVLEFRQAPWWWTVTAIMMFCILVQTYVLINKYLIARSGRPQVLPPDPQEDKLTVLGT
jgi:TRAP-type C4-dicarboxylate transport system permease small subunit